MVNSIELFYFVKLQNGVLKYEHFNNTVNQKLPLTRNYDDKEISLSLSDNQFVGFYIIITLVFNE